MRALILILGESFRMGTQYTRIRGTPESYDEQIRASESHVAFLKHISAKYAMKSISVFIATYTTPFDAKLLDIYRDYKTGHQIYDDVMGLNALFHHSLRFIRDKSTIDDFRQAYDFILYFRIDLFLKAEFIGRFDPRSDTILYPCVCFIPHHRVGNDPRVNDTMMFIPSRLFSHLSSIMICHESWHYLVSRGELTYDDLGTMISTFHDSDSFKDWNPLYYIVNREQNATFHSAGYTFNKRAFS
jgi:hypothetical protein